MASLANDNETVAATRIRRVIAARLGLDAAAVTDSARFVEDLKATSLDIVELIMSIEDEFGIEISDAASEKFLAVGDVVAFVEASVAGGRAKAIGSARTEANPA